MKTNFEGCTSRRCFAQAKREPPFFFYLQQNAFWSAQAPCSRGRACLLPCCDVGFIKQRVPLSVFYYHIVMRDSSNRVYFLCVGRLECTQPIPTSIPQDKPGHQGWDPKHTCASWQGRPCNPDKHALSNLEPRELVRPATRPCRRVRHKGKTV